MASVTGTFVPTYQGLSASDLVRGGASRVDCFPFNVPHRLPFYRARNAIYYLFRALLETNPGLTVLAPDYNSGNEILAMRAAGAALRYCPVRRDMRLDPEDVATVQDAYFSSIRRSWGQQLRKVFDELPNPQWWSTR